MIPNASYQTRRLSAYLFTFKQFLAILCSMKKQRYTLTQLVVYLKERAEKAGSQKFLAEELGVSAQYLGDVISEKREPGKKILDALRMRKVVFYESEGE